jgi:hypothetical protein
LSKLFGSETKALKHCLNLLFLDLFKALGQKTTASIDFEYKNGNRGHAIIVPWVKDEESLQRQAKKMKWIESSLEHVSDKNDAAQ